MTPRPGPVPWLHMEHKKHRFVWSCDICRSQLRATDVSGPETAAFIHDHAHGNSVNQLYITFPKTLP